MTHFFKVTLLIGVVSILIGGCTSAQSAEPALSSQPIATETPTAIPEPTATTEPTTIPEPTATPEPTSEFAELTDEELNDALLAAIRADDAATVTELISLGADVNSIGKIGGVTPILVATLRNNLEIFSLLHEAGADVTITDSSGSSLLHHAANNNAVEIATILLTLDGIDMEHRRDKWEFTPLLLAAFEGNIEMVDLLVSHGANIEANDKWEDTPLNTAAWNGKLEVVQRLVELGAKTDVINVEGKGPLDHARGQKHEDVEAFLLTVIEE